MWKSHFYPAQNSISHVVKSAMERFNLAGGEFLSRKVDVSIVRFMSTLSL